MCIRDSIYSFSRSFLLLPNNPIVFLLYNFRFVRLSKFQSINPRCQFFMPYIVLEDFPVHQLCAFAARRKAFVRLANAASSGGCKRDDLSLIHI